MRSWQRSLHVPSLLLISAVLAAGCGSHSSHGSPSEPVTILLAGECQTDSQIILCHDSSTSIPARRLLSVEWSVSSATTGFPRGSEQGLPGDQVSFAGLGAGTYQVMQRVRATDGGAAEHVYPALFIAR